MYAEKLGDIARLLSRRKLRLVRMGTSGYHWRITDATGELVEDRLLLWKAHDLINDARKFTQGA